MNNKPITITDWTIESVGETQTIGVKGFQKRLLVITDKTAKYQQFRVIEATQDKCADLDGYAKGDKVKVDFWFEGRQWTNKQGVLQTFNADKLASIEKISHDWDQSIDMEQIVKSQLQRPSVSATESASTNNDLPF